MKIIKKIIKNVFLVALGLIIAVNSTEIFSVIAETDSSGTYNPIVTASPNLEKNLGDAVNWTEGISATWGKTTTNTIPTMGEIVDTTLIDGNDLYLSSDGIKFDKIGVKNHNYSIKDNTGDNAKTEINRKIIVRTTNAPAFEIYYAGTTTVYDGSWLSQNATDANRKWGLDLVATTTESLAIGGHSGIRIENEATGIIHGALGQGIKVENYIEQSPSAAGVSFYAVLADSYELIELSPKTAKKVVKIDNTAPIVNVTTDNNWANVKDASTDSLSGIDKTYIKFVPAGSIEPLASPDEVKNNWTEIEAGGDVAVNLSAGTYDLYATTFDNATNISTVVKIASAVAINNKSLSATGFEYGINEEKLDGDIAKKLAGVTASDGHGNNVLIDDIQVDTNELNVIVNSQKNSITGEYPLTFRYGDKNVTVKVNLKQFGTGEVNTTSRITANTFGVGIDEAILNDSVAKARSTVKAVDNSNNNIASSSLTVDANQLADIGAVQGSKMRKNLPLTFKTPDNTSLAVTVRTYSHGKGGNNSAYIVANDFDYGIDEQELNEDIVEALSYVYGQRENGSQAYYDEITVDNNEMSELIKAQKNKKAGVYPLSFTTPDNVTVKVQVTLKNHGVRNIDRYSHIVANDFIYGIDEGLLSEDEVKYRSQVTSDIFADLTDIDDIELADFTELDAVNDAILSNKAGEFFVTLKSVDDEMVKVKVILKNHSLSPDFNHQKGNIGANDFIYDNGLGKLTAAKSILLAGGIAVDQYGNTISDGDIEVSPNDLEAINQAIVANLEGNFPLMLRSLNDNQSVIINVKLNKKSKIANPAKKSDEKFLVTFLDCYGNSVKLEWVKAGNNATAPAGYGKYDGYENINSHRDLKPNGCNLNTAKLTNYKSPKTGDTSTEFGWYAIIFGCFGLLFWIKRSSLKR